MTETRIEGLEGVAQAAASIDLGGEREPDALEQRLAEETELDSVEIRGPNGTHGAEAVAAVVDAALSPPEGALIDPEPFLVAPKIEGLVADKLVIGFSGAVAFDAKDATGQDLYRRLSLGDEVELRVAGTVTGKQGAYKLSANDEETITGKVVVKVDTVYVLDPEEL